MRVPLLALAGLLCLQQAQAVRFPDLHRHLDVNRAVDEQTKVSQESSF